MTCIGQNPFNKVLARSCQNLSHHGPSASGHFSTMATFFHPSRQKNPYNDSCLTLLYHGHFFLTQASLRQNQLGHFNSTLFFHFWPISSSSQCYLSQLIHQSLHTNFGRARTQQTVPTILTQDCKWLFYVVERFSCKKIKSQQQLHYQ